MKLNLANGAMIFVALLLAGCGGGGSSRDGGTLPIIVPGPSNSLTVIWQHPASNVDGSPLIDLAGFNLYGAQTGDPADLQLITTINNGGIDRFLVESLAPGSYYFAVTAFNNAGAESDFSNILQGTIH